MAHVKAIDGTLVKDRRPVSLAWTPTLPTSVSNASKPRKVELVKGSTADPITATKSTGKPKSKLVLTAWKHNASTRKSTSTTIPTKGTHTDIPTATALALGNTASSVKLQLAWSFGVADIAKASGGSRTLTNGRRVG